MYFSILEDFIPSFNRAQHTNSKQLERWLNDPQSQPALIARLRRAKYVFKELQANLRGRII